MLTPEEISINWKHLQAWFTPYEEPSTPIRKTFNCMRGLFDFYKDDFVDEDGVRVYGMMNAPAATGVHHNYEGGLVQHYLEMLEMTNGVIRLVIGNDSISTDDISTLKVGIILHDFHKAYLHFCQSPGGKYGDFAYYKHLSNVLLTDNQKTWHMLDQVNYKVDIPFTLRNLVESSEGGWADNPPKEVTVLGKICYLLDELSVVKHRVAVGNIYSIYPRSRAFMFQP